MSYSKNLSVIILAAGKSKRIKSEIPKALHSICYQPILYYILSSVNKINPKNVFVVVGHKSELIDKYVKSNFPDIETVYQKKQLGTAHAVLAVKECRKDLGKDILVLPGDCPLITSGSLKKLVDRKIKTSSAAVVLTTAASNPKGYGRIIKDRKGNILKIVEEADATYAEKKINEVNSSMYCFDKKILFGNIENIDSKNSQKEYYLTDIVEKMVENGNKVACLKISNSKEALGINDRIQLSEVEKVMQGTINEKMMQNGVTIKDPGSCYIGGSVKIGRDSVVEPFCFIKGKSIIGSNCVIGPFSQITDTEVGSGSKVNSSVIIDAVIGKNNNIGPYSYIRPDTVTGENVKIGAFCEVKKSKINSRSKVPHLSYVGDTEIGSGVNVGASSVTVNYDGYRKNKTIIEDNVFIGSDTMLIAPVRIGKGAVVAAGSVITDDVPSNCLAIERGSQKNIKDGAVKYRKKKEMKE